MNSDHIEVLRAYEMATGRSCAGLFCNSDLISAGLLNGRQIMRMGELIEEGCGVTLLPAQLLDWTIFGRTAEALARLVEWQRGEAAPRQTRGAA